MFQNGNVFQQAQFAQALSLPYDRVVAMPTQSMPNLSGVSVSVNMQPFAGSIIATAIGKIQTQASQTFPRTFFFNVMAQDGYNNALFKQFVNELLSYVETMVMVTGRYPQQIAEEAIDAFLTYKVAGLALMNQQLCAAVGQQTYMLLQQAVGSFEASWNNVQNELRRVQQGGNRQGSFGGGPNQGTIAMPMMGGGGGGNAGYGGGSSIFSSAGSPVYGGSYGSGGVNISAPTEHIPMNNNAVQPRVETLRTAAPSQVVISPMTASTNEAVSLTTQGNNTAPQNSQQASSASEPARVQAVGDSKSVKWKPSVQYPSLPTYDPNKEDLKFLVMSDGTIQPTIALKSTMDQQKHLAAPEITPTWTTMTQQQAVAAQQPEKSRVLTPGDLRQVFYPQGASTVATHKENWTYAEAYMLSQRSEVPSKATMAQKYAMLMDTIIGSSKVTALLHSLTQTSNAAESSKLLAAALDEAMRSQDYLDIRSIRHVIRRLWLRTNRFLAVDMSIPGIAIDKPESYIEDAPALAGYTTSKIGVKTGKVFEDAHKTIVAQACNLAEGELREAINDGEFSECKIPLEEDHRLIHLYNNVVYGVVDLSTIELRAQIPARKDGDKYSYSALISESNTPLLAALAKYLFDKKSAEEQGGAGFTCDRFLLRTNDGVTLELAPAAFTPGEIVVALHGSE
jgi:hypothetical protein